MSVAILRQGDHVIASILTDLSDREVIELRDDIAERVGRDRLRGVIVDVSALEFMDSFVARSLRSLALTVGLRGARTTIAGIQPEVAVAIVHFRLDLAPLQTALDLDEAIALLATPDMGGGDGR
jgi:rsbT antagonist protein RsbS